MKMNVKAKDFADKANLQKTLSTKLKKPLSHIIKNTSEQLPFCYEAEYFDDGGGFLSIGVAKEIQKLFKTKRSKGQGTDENGKAVKIDKKKVAYGTVSINEEGKFVFNVKGGMMKSMQAKKCIKSIGILKKKIGDNFIITSGDVAAPKKEATPTPASKASDTSKTENKGNNSPEWVAKKAKIKSDMAKMKAQLEQLKSKLA